MARKSAASLSVVANFKAQLPDPPSTFTPSQASVWCAVVATKPVDWFQADCMPVLADYCRAVDMSNEIAAAVDGFDRTTLVDSGSVKAWERLIKLQREQQAHVATLGTKLRLTPQSRYTPKASATAAGKVGAERPWSRVIPHEAKETQSG